MLCEIYTEALLADEDLADFVWQAWNVGELSDEAACRAWQLVVSSSSGTHLSRLAIVVLTVET